MRPTIEDLMTKAQRVQYKDCGPFASDYIPVIAILRSRNLTWQEITDWFRQNGFTFSQQSLYQVWHKYERRHRRLAAEARTINSELAVIDEIRSGGVQ